MKIVLATPIYPPEIGGPATYTKELCERLGTTHDISVVAYTHNGVVFPNTKLFEVEKYAPLPLRLFRFFLATLRASKGADVIYAQNAVAAGLPAVLAGMLRRIPVVIKFVGDEAWERATQQHLTEKRLEEFLEHPDGNTKTKLMLTLQGFVLRRAEHVTTPSVYLGEAITRAYHLDPVRVMPNYNASEEEVHETPVFPIEKKPHQIAVTARLTAWKGIDGIIRALLLVQKKYPDANLVIAGEGPERDNLTALVAELGLEKSVAFLNNISRAETWQLREESGVYVLNSTYEGLPHTILTSFAARIPVVATNISGTNEAVVHEENGLLVEPGDNTALALAITRYFDDSALCARMVEGGTKTLHEKFSWSTHLKNLENILAV